MGRTNATYRDLLRSISNSWRDYRRALRRRDEPAFDQLFEYGREHADAAGYLNHEEPMFPLLVSICLEQQKRIDRLEDRIAALEADDDIETGD